jgi:integrase
MSVEHVLTATPDVKEELWHWPLDVARYDRCPDLRPDERTSIARIARRVRPGAEWPQRIRCVLGRLRLPLEDAMAYLDVCDRTQRSALRILVLEMHRRQKAFWGWSQGQWAEMLCPSAAEFLSRHTSEHDCRSNLVAFGYLLNLFDDFNALGPFRRSTLAENIFGAVRLARAFGRVIEAIRRCGYQSHKAHGESIRQCLSEVLLRGRSPHLEDITLALLERVRSSSTTPRMTAYIYTISRALAALGILTRPLGCGWRSGKNWNQGSATQGVANDWVRWVERWRNTTTFAPKTRYSMYINILQAGRWLAMGHPEITEPAQWTRQIAAEYVAAVCRVKVGEWMNSSATQRSPYFGKPASPRTRVAYLAAVRTFFRDCQEWEWIPRNFNPSRCLAPPSSVLALIRTEPRVIADDVWAKLLWAGLNLTEADLSRNGLAFRGFYPPSMLRALTVVWLFAGLRCGEIRRLLVGCARRRDEPIMAKDGVSGLSQAGICMLDVPANKTCPNFTKPVDGVVWETIREWERQRPPQSLMVDEKEAKLVHYLFAYRNRQIGETYINKYLIPRLCRKAGVPLTDARGRITSHRARSTIASQLFNAKEPMTLFQLQEWLGHRTPMTTQHYAKIAATKLAKSYADAGYFKRNIRAIEVLIDREVVLNGTAASEPWRFYDLGHGYCTYDFFDQCPHRMACAKCGFYVAKASTKAQLLEGKNNLLRLRQEIPLGELELAAVDDGVTALEQLVAQLEDVPTPAGPTPRQLGLVQIKDHS